jgi:periplasmic copper chaperone A
MPAKRSALLYSFAALGLISLSACKQETSAGDAATSTAPDAKPGIAITGGKLVMPAVLGNPGAAYFTLANTGDKPVSIVDVAIDGAESTEMHFTTYASMTPLTQVEAKAGETIKFEAGGKHVMAFKLKPDLSPGSNVEMTVTFADGDKVSAPLAVVAPGGAMADHGDMH